MGIGAALQELIEKNNTNVNELAKKVSISPQTLYSIISRDNMKVRFDILVKLSDALGVGIDYFCHSLSNYSKIELTSSEKAYIEQYRRLNEAGQNKVKSYTDDLLANPQYLRFAPTSNIQLDYYALPASAGTGIYLDSDDKESLEVPSSPLAQKADFAIRVSGNSMEPFFFDGDILLVEACSVIEHGEIGIFILNGEGFVKRLYCKDHVCKLISLNLDYADIPIDDMDTLLCRGKVLGKLEPITT